MSNIIQKNDIKGLINSESMREQFARALPKHLSPERFARIAITALTRTPKLAECTPASVMKCLLDLSAMGLEPDGRRAHLIPYGNEATLIIDYKGLVELIRRSGDVVSVRAETVCEKDLFQWTDGVVSHSVNWREDRGKIQAVYAEAVMKSGERQSAVMTTKEVEAIRARSRSGNSGPWVTDWAEMAKRTPFAACQKCCRFRLKSWRTLNGRMTSSGACETQPRAKTRSRCQKPLTRQRSRNPRQRLPLTSQTCRTHLGERRRRSERETHAGALGGL